MWRWNAMQQTLLFYLQNTRRLYKWKATDNLRHGMTEIVYIYIYINYKIYYVRARLRAVYPVRSFRINGNGNWQ